jgi:HAD superfamily hydrolase (TIGR01509 family)
MSPLFASMGIRNVVFDVGGVLLEWNPPAVIARHYPDPARQAALRQQIFEHADWHEFDRGGLTEQAAIDLFAQRTGLSRDETRALMHAARESLTPIDGTIDLLDDLADAGLHLFLLSNMPESTYDYLVGRHAFFAHFKHLVISGKILLVKPDAAIFRHLVEQTGILPGESIFIDDLTANVAAARECGLHAIQFRDPASCRRELRAYLPTLN